VIALPSALAPWTELLASLAPDLADAVGVLARRLSPILERVRPRPLPRGDDPDGYGGLARRGPYERLLLSEWALAEELPQEFERRAAMGEHAFLELDRRTPVRSTRVVALFDGGPDQLGSPRVVQLAALVVLARRALLAGAELAWGPLQSTGPLQATTDRASIEAFLAGRTGRPAAPEDLLGAGRERLGPAWDELWLIGSATLGGPAFESVAPKAVHLAIADVIDPELRAVDVRLRAAGRPLGEARLDLPAPEIGRRLLATPFRIVADRPARLAPPTPPPDEPAAAWAAFPRGGHDPLHARFLPGARQLLVVLQSGTAYTWGFPLDGSAPAPKPGNQLAMSSEPGVAIGYHQQKISTVTLTKEGLVRVDGRAPISPTQLGVRVPAVGHGVHVTRGALDTFVDGAGVLHVVTGSSLQPHGPAAGLFGIGKHVFAVLPRPGGLVVVHVRADGVLVPCGEIEGDRMWPGAWSSRAEIGLLLTAGPGGVDAYQLSCHAKGVSIASRPIRPVAVHDHLEIVGMGITDGKPTPILWDTRRKSFTHPGTGVTLTPARTPLAPSVSATGNEVAWCTPEGFLEVWSLRTGRALLLRHGA
jgi:hypothetical protein